MQDLVNDLLAYSRVAGTRNSAPVDLHTTVDWALANLKTAIVESSASITIDEPLPTICADHVQLVQVLQNLLSNAMKYRHRDRNPQIQIRATRDGVEWIISVQDNGIGIAPQYHERIFGLFKRLHGREVPGTGIGLAICKRIVEHHGGRIWLTSEPGRGTTFSFTVPVQPQ